MNYLNEKIFFLFLLRSTFFPFQLYRKLPEQLRSKTSKWYARHQNDWGTDGDERADGLDTFVTQPILDRGGGKHGDGIIVWLRRKKEKKKHFSYIDFMANFDETFLLRYLFSLFFKFSCALLSNKQVSGNDNAWNLLSKFFFYSLLIIQVLLL